METLLRIDVPTSDDRLPLRAHAYARTRGAQAAKKAEQDRLDAIRQAELQRQAEEAARQAALGSAAAIPGASAVLSMGESVSSWLGSAAPQGSYAGSVLSYLGGAVAPLVGLAGAKQVRKNLQAVLHVRGRIARQLVGNSPMLPCVPCRSRR